MAGFLLFVTLAVTGWTDEIPNLNQWTFELKDQYGKVHRIGGGSDLPIIITIADRKSAENVRAWVEPLDRQYPGGLQFVAIASVSEIPWLWHSYTKAQFRRHFDRPILLDWEGEVTRRLGFQSGRLRLLVFTPDGAFVVHAEGKATPNRLEMLRRRLAPLTPPER